MTGSPAPEIPPTRPDTSTSSTTSRTTVGATRSHDPGTIVAPAPLPPSAAQDATAAQPTAGPSNGAHGSTDDVPSPTADGAAGTSTRSSAAVATAAGPDPDDAIPDDAELSLETLPADLWETAVPAPAEGDDARHAEPLTPPPAAPGRRSPSRRSRRSGKSEPERDGLALPEDADEGIKDTMDALRSLFPGHTISVEPPNDGSQDGEPTEVGVALGIAELPADPDTSEPELDEDAATLPRRAARPDDGVA